MRVNTLYGTKEVVTEQGRQIELKYYLVQEIRSGQWQEGQCDTEQGESITYGIQIIKRERERIEQEELLGLSRSMNSVERLLRQMMYGLVTPANAAEVADDWVSAMVG